MKLLTLFSCLVVVIAADKVNNNNYKVFRVFPISQQQIQILDEWIRSEEGCSFWDDNRDIILVNREKLNKFNQTINAKAIKSTLIHEDIDGLIEEQSKETTEDPNISWSQYNTLNEIYKWLESLPNKHPGIVRIIIGGKTYEGRTIKGIQISFGKNNPGIFIESGIHASEWIGPATATYLINEFLTSKNLTVRKLAESHDWYIFPTINPDGYVYSHTTERKWRKNRAKLENNCYGVDLNRNWGYKWNDVGASNDSCGFTYAGKNAFSEVETKTLSQFIESINDNLFAYIAFHSYAQLLIIPYSFTTEKLDNYNETYAIGNVAVNALAQRYGTKYVVGTAIETIHAAAGASMDWIKATFKFPLVYTYEFRDKGQCGLLLPPEQIIPNSEEVLDSFVAMFDEARKYGYPKP